MPVQRVIITFCFLSMYFYYARLIEVRINARFLAKHTMESNKEIENIPLSYIREKFDEMQKDQSLNFITYRIREKHSYIVTSNLPALKNDIIKAYNMSTQFEYKTKEGYFVKTGTINLAKLRHKKGVIHFKIEFRPDEEKYYIKDNTCEYSDKGTFILGAAYSRATHYEDEINHLSKVNLNIPKVCKVLRPKSLPPRPGTCRERKRFKSIP